MSSSTGSEGEKVSIEVIEEHRQVHLQLSAFIALASQAHLFLQSTSALGQSNLYSNCTVSFSACGGAELYIAFVPFADEGFSQCDSRG